MFGIGPIEIALLLIVFGGFAAMAALFALAMKGAAGRALLVGGLGFFGLLFAAMVLFLYLARGSVSIDQPQIATVTIGDEVYHPTDDGNFVSTSGHPFIETPQRTIDGAPQAPPITITRDNHTWAIALTPVIFIAIGVVALLVLAARRGLGHSAACGRGRLWPAFLALPLLALLFVGNVRYHSATSRDASNRAGQINQAVRNQQRAIVKQQQAMAKRVQSMSADVHQQIGNMDINKLMDRFDAPRIMLQAPMTPMSPPVALMLAAATPPAAPLTETPPPAPTPPAAKAKPTNPASAKSGKSGTPTKRKRDVQPSVAAKAEKPATIEAEDVAPAAPAQPRAAARPPWLDNPPKRVGDIQKEVVITDEWATDEECEKARNIALMLKTYEHIQKLVGAPYQKYLLDHRMHSDDAWRDDRLAQLISNGITLDYVLRHVAKEEYIETVDRSVGPMKKIYTLVEFTPDVNRDLRRSWETSQRREQFAKVGVGAASIFGLLGMIWGLLKLDTATKGYYTKRLFIGVPAAIIVGLLVMSLVMAKTGRIGSGPSVPLPPGYTFSK